MFFIVIDKKTSKQITIEDVYREEPDWIKPLTYTRSSDLEFAVTQDGELLVIDACGNYIPVMDDWEAIRVMRLL